MKRWGKWLVVAMVVLNCVGSTVAMAAETPASHSIIDLNTASKDELMTLPGVGPSKADAIMAHRQLTPFATVEDVQQVKGVGPGLYAKIRDFLKVGNSPAPVWKAGEAGSTKK